MIIVILFQADQDNINLNLNSKELECKINNETILTENVVSNLSNKTLIEPKILNNGFIADSNGSKLLSFSEVDNSVNNLKITNSSKSNAPTLSVQGDDGNIDLNFSSKGEGIFVFKKNNSQIKINPDGDSNTILKSSSSNERIIILPDISDTLVSKNTIDILTNKTLTSPKILNDDFIADENGKKILVFGSITAENNAIPSMV